MSSWCFQGASMWPQELPAAAQPAWDRQSVWPQPSQQLQHNAPTFLQPDFAWSAASSRSASPPHYAPFGHASFSGAPTNFQPIPTGSRRRLPKERKTNLIARHSTLRPDAPEFVPRFGPQQPEQAQQQKQQSRASLAEAVSPTPGSTLSSSPRSQFAAASSGVSSDSDAHDHEHDQDQEHELGGDDDNVEDGMALSQKYLYHRYVVVLEKALSERTSVGAGNSVLVHSLYTFWIGRLTHKFNRNMYRMFVRLALEDLNAGDRTGLDALYRFYAASLRSLYRERLFRDFVHFVSADTSDNNSGVEILWLLMKDFPRAHQDGVLRCYTDLCASLESLDSLGRLSLD